jgi:electron transport complex protein RnfB
MRIRKNRARYNEPVKIEVAVIDETACIGCTLCLAACPVDAIVGSAKRMHTVIAAECTGCRLCLPPCPVDCIAMVEAPGGRAPGEIERAALRARQREAARRERLERGRVEREENDRRKSAERKKHAAIERAMQRARQRLQRR